VVVQAVPAARWLVAEPDASSGDAAVSTDALYVHRALATMAAARQDLTVLISFPRWYGADLVERHLGQLGGHLDRLHAHHPWGVVAGDATGAPTIAVPADGAVAGRLAQGSIERGPWVAVAGTPLAGVLGVATGLEPSDPLRLRAAQVNSLVPTRRGVMLTGVDTLARDREIRPVTVRRLLILVRRLALREGRELVFEPNGPDLRRLLRTRFEAALGLVYRLGGLAGSSTAQAYRVLCDEGLNPPRVTDAGQVVIELQLAPSYPLEFLVLRLVRAGDGGFQLAEVTR
jgi:phage tail sheath protein FI